MVLRHCKGGAFSSLRNNPALCYGRRFNTCRGLQPRRSSSTCSYEGDGAAKQAKLDGNTAAALYKSIMYRCGHVWEKKGSDFALESSSLLDLVKLSIRLSPRTMRRFWRVSVLRPEDVLDILTGFGLKVNRKEVQFMLELFVWAGKQNWDFRHLPRSYEVMVSLLVGQRMLGEAESLLLEAGTRKIPVPGLNCFFSEIIQGYAELGDLKSSIALYDRARSHLGVVLDVSCYRALLRCLVRLKKADLTMRVYMHMVEESLVSNTENLTLDFVVRTLCMNEKVLEAVKLLRRVKNLGIEVSNASLDVIADAYCRKRDFEDLSKFLKEWRHLPGKCMSNKILSCLCKSQGTDMSWLFMKKMETLGFEADSKTFQVYIRWSCKEGRLSNAFMYLSELFSRMLTPDVQAYNAILSGVFKAGMWKYSKEVYADMCEKGILPDMSTFRIILAGFLKERKFDEATFILEEMVNHDLISLSQSEDALPKAFSVLGLDYLHVKVKRDNNMLFPEAEFFDSLGNGLYLDTDMQMCNKALTRILDDAFFPDYDRVVTEACNKHDIMSALIMKDEATQHGWFLLSSTYSGLLKGLITSKSFIKEAADILDENPELCDHLDCRTLNLLLKVFGKNGISHKAHMILDVLHLRKLPMEADTYSAIIMAFCRLDIDGFQEFWSELQRSNCVPEVKDVRFLINALVKREMFKEVFVLFENMSSSHPQFIPAICNAFVKEFCRTNSVTLGYIFADEVHQRGCPLKNSTYEYLAAKLCREKMVNEAFHMLDLLLERNFTPSTSLCQTLAELSFRFKGTEKAKSLKEVKGNEKHEALFVLHRISLNKVQTWRIMETASKLQKLLTQDLLPFRNILEIMIKIYCQESHMRKAFEILCLMIKMDMRLDISTYRDLVRLTCSIGHINAAFNLKDMMLRECVSPSNVIYNILIFYLFMGGSTSYIGAVLDDMQQHACNLDQVSYNFLIHGYYKCRNAEKSVDLLKIMISKYLEPNNRSLKAVIYYLCSCFRLDEAIKLYKAMERKGWKCSSVIQTLLVKHLLSHGRLHEAEQLLLWLEDGDLTPKNACYDTLIKCFCRIGRVNVAVNLLNFMLKNGGHPCGSSYNSVLQCYLACNSFDEALDIHAEMLHNKIQPSMESYENLIHCLFENGRTDEAERILDVMLASDQVPSSSMFHAALDKYRSENNLHKASELLGKMQHYGILPDFGTHWSLINDLSSINNKKDDPRKGLLTYLLSHTCFPAKGYNTEGDTTMLKSMVLP